MWCEAFDFTGFSQLDTKISSCLMVDYAKKKKTTTSLIHHEYEFASHKHMPWALMTKAVVCVGWGCCCYLWEAEEWRNLRNELSHQPSSQSLSVSCCLWWNQSLGDFILHGWQAGMCFCLGSAALALIWGGRPFVLYQASNNLASVDLCCLFKHLLH